MAMSNNIYPLAVQDEQTHNAIPFPVTSFQSIPTQKEVFLCFLCHLQCCASVPLPRVVVADFERQWARRESWLWRCVSALHSISRKLWVFVPAESSGGGEGNEEKQGKRSRQQGIWLFCPRLGSACLLQAPGIAVRIQHIWFKFNLNLHVLWLSCQVHCELLMAAEISPTAMRSHATGLFSGSHYVPWTMCTCCLTLEGG